MHQMLMNREKNEILQRKYPLILDGIQTNECPT